MLLKLNKNCDCYLTKVKSVDVKTSAFAECDLRKFTEYIFTDSKKSKGKLAIFESLGYNKNDSNILKEEYEKQATEKYLNGDYIIRGLSPKYGQDININIELISPTGKKVNFISGWKVHPLGLITCNTPLADD